MNNNKITTVILDWAGTTVDYGCFAPVNAFLKAFKKFGINPSLSEIREPMGMLKIDHIRTMLGMERISYLWKKNNGRAFTENDVQSIYAEFEKNIFESLADYAKPKPSVCDTVEKLRSMDIHIGSTTGYTDRMMSIVAAEAKKCGYVPDMYATPDITGGYGRPYPYMIFKNMEKFGTLSVASVVKVGDTVSDINEGKNAGVWTVGVIEGSSELGLSEDEYGSLSENEKKELADKTEKTFKSAGADFVISDISGLISVINKINM